MGQATQHWLAIQQPTHWFNEFSFIYLRIYSFPCFLQSSSIQSSGSFWAVEVDERLLSCVFDTACVFPVTTIIHRECKAVRVNIINQIARFQQNSIPTTVQFKNNTQVLKLAPRKRKDFFLSFIHPSFLPLHGKQGQCPLHNPPLPITAIYRTVEMVL